MDTKGLLAANARRRNVIELSCTALLVAAMLAAAAWLISRRPPSSSFVMVVFESVFIAVAAGYGFLQLLLPLMKWLCDRFAPEWVVEDCGDVVKVHGSVPLMDLDKVEQRMLSVREGFRPVDKAWERFGCTMAAVPASAASLRAKQEFEQLKTQLQA